MVGFCLLDEEKVTGLEVVMWVLVSVVVVVVVVVVVTGGGVVVARALK
jgi:hypothetical protein